jgi:ERCC4-type nuclease
MTPTVIVDTREQDPLPLEFPTVRQGLYSGDYSVVGCERLFAVERKSLDDLAASVGTERARFEHELQRLAGIRFRRLLVVGIEKDLTAGNYRSRIHPNAVLASLRAFEVRYDLPVVFEPTPTAAARRVEEWAKWFAREVCQAAEAIRPTLP